LIASFDQLYSALTTSVAHPVEGEVFPFEVPRPNLCQVVEQARQHPKIRILSGERGDCIALTFQPPAIEFPKLPLSEAVKMPIHLSLFELGPLRETDGALAEVIQEVYLPLIQLWRTHHVSWQKVYPILFLSGPNCSTNYHWDPSSVLIVQLHGRKRFHSLKEAGRWCSPEVLAQQHAGMVKPANLSDKDILVYELEPGDAVWSPCRAPHWLDAYDETAFTLSIAFTDISAEPDKIAEMRIL